MNVFKKYGVWEYFLVIIGMILLSSQTYKYVIDTLEYRPLELIVFLAGVLLVSAPATLVGLVKQAARKKVDK